MSELRNVNIRAQDSPSIDAFARLRTSGVTTLFDSKQIFDNQPLFWDDQEVSGSGTTSVHSVDEAATTIGVGATTAGKRVRQTFQRFNYQPGKSQLIFATFSEFTTATGITKCVGYYDDDNGILFKSDEGNVKASIRSSTSGSPVDTDVDQTDWNLDKMDGTGNSGITLDFDKTQIAIIDFEWLGVGRVRMGFVVDGLIYYCHEFLNANNLAVVYMSSPNLPMRYEIANDGTGAADEFMHICCSVNSEGGTDETGVLRHHDVATLTALSSGTKYAAIGIKLKTTHLGASILIENVSLISTSQNDQAHWELVFNPDVASTFTYSDVTNSSVQTADGVKANVVTNGTEVDGGYFETSLAVSQTVPNALRIGSAIDGTPDEIILVIKPITNNISVQASITWRELS